MRKTDHSQSHASRFSVWFQFGKQEELERSFLATQVSKRYIIRDVGLWCNGSTLTCPVKRCGFKSRPVHTVLV